eukprot:4585054-Pyramimonas_sp.AAC.1
MPSLNGFVDGLNQLNGWNPDREPPSHVSPWHTPGGVAPRRLGSQCQEDVYRVPSCGRAPACAVQMLEVACRIHFVMSSLNIM